MSGYLWKVGPASLDWSGENLFGLKKQISWFGENWLGLEKTSPFS